MPRDDLNRFRAHLEEVPLDYRMSLYAANQPIQYVYFPIEGVASLVTTMKNGSAAEVGTIGNEGIVGVPVILGDTTSPTDVYVQVEGKALRLRSDIFRDLIAEHRGARILMLHYVHAFFNQVAQSAACNHFHKLEQRACRWILMTHDRVQTDDFPLTQEFLAMMLGVRRTGVTEAAQVLKRKKFIKYSRGHVTVLDRAGLEGCSCECYEVSKREYDRLLGPAT
jgi:CRP-like cAMP-binding protein